MTERNINRLYVICESGYPESPSDFGTGTVLDSRLRGNDGKFAILCHTREGGYPESMVQLSPTTRLMDDAVFYILSCRT